MVVYKIITKTKEYEFERLEDALKKMEALRKINGAKNAKMYRVTSLWEQM